MTLPKTGCSRSSRSALRLGIWRRKLRRETGEYHLAMSEGSPRACVHILAMVVSSRAVWVRALPLQHMVCSHTLSKRTGCSTDGNKLEGSAFPRRPTDLH